MKTLRVATYNVHRCRGIDGRVKPERIAAVLKEVDADVIALQEVVNVSDGEPHEHQAAFLASELGLNWQLGENRRFRGGAYGNVILSRHAMRRVENYDLSVKGYERRGCLHIDVDLEAGQVLHIFNVHLGTDYMERRHQGRRLIGAEILLNRRLNGPRLMLGDFNEWAPGLTTKLLKSHLQSVDIRKHLKRTRTYPGLVPLLHLDHIYHDEELELRKLTLHRTRKALVASDHLPLVADFKLLPRTAGTRPTRKGPAVPS